MVLLEFSMYPTDKGESVSEYVARSIDIIDRSGLSYQLTPMGTIIEGEYDEVMRVVKECFDLMSSDCVRVAVNLKIDYRKGKSGRLSSKIESVEKRLGREVRK